MDPKFKAFTDYLVELGTDHVPHSDTPFLSHLIGVCRDLERWGCEQAVCRAGLFHSIYGTQQFQRFCLPLERRMEVRELIGERAEYLAYLNCAMYRPSFDGILEHDGPLNMADRLTGQEIELSEETFTDLCTLHLCDWLEQVPRTKQWDFRRIAYRRMAERLGGVAKEAYDDVFLQEKRGSKSG